MKFKWKKNELQVDGVDVGQVDRAAEGRWFFWAEGEGIPWFNSSNTGRYMGSVESAKNICQAYVEECLTVKGGA